MYTVTDKDRRTLNDFSKFYSQNMRTLLLSHSETNNLSSFSDTYTLPFPKFPCKQNSLCIQKKKKKKTVSTLLNKLQREKQLQISKKTIILGNAPDRWSSKHKF